MKKENEIQQPTEKQSKSVLKVLQPSKNYIKLKRNETNYLH